MRHLQNNRRDTVEGLTMKKTIALAVLAAFFATNVSAGVDSNGPPSRAAGAKGSLQFHDDRSSTSDTRPKTSLSRQDYLRVLHGAPSQVKAGKTIDGVSTASRKAAVSRAVDRAMKASAAKRAAGK
jgi:hypothetical protein